MSDKEREENTVPGTEPLIPGNAVNPNPYKRHTWKTRPTDYTPEATYRVINYSITGVAYQGEQRFTASGNYLYFDRFLEGRSSLYIKFGRDTNPWVRLNEGDCYHIKFTRFTIKSEWDALSYTAFPLRARFIISDEPFIHMTQRARKADGFNVEQMRSITVTTSGTPNTPLPLISCMSGQAATGFEYGGKILIHNHNALDLYICGRQRIGGLVGIRIASNEKFLLDVSGGNPFVMQVWCANASALSTWTFGYWETDNTQYSTLPAVSGLYPGAEY